MRSPAEPEGPCACCNASDERERRREHEPDAWKILLVEDDEDARVALATLLRLYGHAVEAVATGGEALAVAAVARFDVALVDVGLPDMDGLELGRRLRRDARGDDLRVALTGYDGAEAREASRAAGFHLHVVKPVDCEPLLALVAVRLRALRDVTESP